MRSPSLLALDEGDDDGSDDDDDEDDGDADDGDDDAVVYEADDDDDDDDGDGDDEDVGGAHQGSGWRIHQRITPARVTRGLVGTHGGQRWAPTRPNAQTPHKRKTNSKRKSSNR